MQLPNNFKMTEEEKARRRAERRMRKKAYRRKKGKILTYSGNTTLYTDIKKDNIGNKKECVSDTQNKIDTDTEND